MKFFLISDNVDTKMGMRFAGIEGVVVHQEDEVRSELEKAVNRDDIAVILITETLVSLCPDLIYDLKLNRKQPLIVETPDRHGNGRTKDSPYYEAAEGGSNTYGVFIMGDNALTVLKSASENAAAGKKIAVVKESYGNAFVPYLTNNYEEVHVIDFRYFKQNLVDYCKTNGIDEVLFVNGVMSANTQVQLDSMSGLFN